MSQTLNIKNFFIRQFRVSSFRERAADILKSQLAAVLSSTTSSKLSSTPTFEKSLQRLERTVDLSELAKILKSQLASQSTSRTLNFTNTKYHEL